MIGGCCSTKWVAAMDADGRSLAMLAAVFRPVRFVVGGRRAGEAGARRCTTRWPGWR